MVGATIIGIVVMLTATVDGSAFGDMAICAKSGRATATATIDASIGLT